MFTHEKKMYIFLIPFYTSYIGSFVCEQMGVLFSKRFWFDILIFLLSDLDFIFFNGTLDIKSWMIFNRFG